MSVNQTPEQVAAGMVRVVSDGGPHRVDRPVGPTVRLQIHQNPA